MFQFPRFPPGRLCVRRPAPGYNTGRVAPFGDRRISVVGRSPARFAAIPRPSSALAT